MPLVANAHHYLRKGGGCTYHMLTICVYVYVDVNRRIICDTCPSLPTPTITFVKETCALGHANACVYVYVCRCRQVYHMRHTPLIASAHHYLCHRISLASATRT